MKNGKAVRYIRIRKGLTQKEVAGNVVTVSFLSKFENGQTSMSFDILVHLLDRMGVGVEEFISISKDLDYENSQFFLIQIIEDIMEKNLIREDFSNLLLKLDKCNCSISMLAKKIINCVTTSESNEQLVREIERRIIEWDYIGHIEVLLLRLFIPCAKEDFCKLVYQRFLKLHSYNITTKEYFADHSSLIATFQKKIFSMDNLPDKKNKFMDKIQQI